ncbi:zinc finger protein 615-like [Cylas formicarius]|uniref:zinc finger protein 615-like n=1 Tax=Cylas formicarius TaxID=197179 RepID=UPI002958AE1C|nr:zinc finger protein 615-like [Cylas formicarius]
MEIEMQEDPYCLYAKNYLENFENWMETEERFPLLEEDSLPSDYSLQKDPLLSQVQLDDCSRTETDSLQDVIATPKSSTLSKHRTEGITQSQAKILNKKNEIEQNTTLTSSLKYKDEILKERPAVSVEMVFISSGIGLFIRDGNGTQIFITQHIKMTSLASPPTIRHQNVKTVNFHPICDNSKITLPQIITNINSKVHLCPVRDCTEAFLQPASAKIHGLKHLAIKPFSCTYVGCKWEFYKENQLNRHLLTHEKHRNYICDMPGCNKDFTTIYNLNEHKKRRHIQPATKLCPVTGCESAFRNDKELLSHCKQHSDNDAPFHCTFNKCTRSFFIRALLDNHLKSHQYGNTYICSYLNCGKICQTAYRLKEHIRSHTGSRPYACNFEGCTWRFTTASQLKRHERTHREGKNFCCTFEGCNKAYRRAEHLKIHSQTHVESSTSYETDAESPAAAYTSRSVHIKKHHKLPKQNKGQTSSQKLYGLVNNGNNLFNFSYPDYSVKLVPSATKSEDELLEEAIKSLGVPEIMSENDALNLLDNEDFSTVNLKDLH